MDTKPLESFAKSARLDLIRAVEARASAVLAAGSVARSERAETVGRLEREIAAHGRAHVIDKVAYTWFNRLIALRFMDAKSYTEAGVVSPAQGQAHGQPEVLADAKRGELDADVITSARTHDAIIGLLDGTRRSTDAEGEAYALLLTEYCRHWHKAMPFMFEREGDYTELLVPAGLLADGSVLGRTRDVLTEDVCEDVEVIGWLYQFYISERKDEVFAGFKKNKKAGADEIPAATQLFTPHWIVRYLVENSLGRLWMLNRPGSRIVDQMDYYIAPVDEETDFLKITSPQELTVIDPACGSGHMLTFAFDLLYVIYEEEGYAPSEIPSLILTHNLHGTEIDSRAGALAAFALTMKARAKDRRYFQRDAEPQICVIEPVSFGPDELDFLVTKAGDRDSEEWFWNQFRDADTLGSLIQPEAEQTKRAAALLETLEDDLLHGQTLELARQVVRQAQALSRTYTVVVANPPYMGSKNMNARLAEFAKANFKESKSDLFAMFVERCLSFVPEGGYTGFMTPFVWMFIASYEALRKHIIEHETITTLVQLEYSGFDGATVPICAYVLRRGASDEIGAFVRLSDFVGAALQGPKTLEIIQADRDARAGEATSGMERHLFRIATSELAEVPGSPIAYWLSDAVRSAFGAGKQLRDLADVKAGVGTRDDARFMRFSWEVSRLRVGRTRKWLPTDKAGEFRKWFAGMQYVMNWENEGFEIRNFKNPDGSLKSRPQNLQFMYREGVTWGKIGSGETSFRLRPEGFGFNDAAPTIFGGHSAEILMQMNSTSCRALIEATGSTLNVQTGMVEMLPVIEGGNLFTVEAQQLIEGLVSSSRRDWNDFETSLDFAAPSWIQGSSRSGLLSVLFEQWSQSQIETSHKQQARETENNRVVSEAFGLQSEVSIDVPLHRVSLSRNVEFRYGPGKTAAQYQALERADLAAELISYAVGCMFGRYSLDEPGLVLADQGTTLHDFLLKVPSPTFMPDADNVVPFVDDGWFEDDIVERFRQFLRVAFGAERFEENLRFVEESLGVKTLRDYFITKAGKSKFYDDHVQRYKKRPIYWMFSSPKGSFNALIYLHRYTPATVSTVLNEYLREYEAKLAVALQQADAAAASGGSAKDQKEADRLRKVLAELRDYEHDVLYPLDIQHVEIDLDDGVKVNYPKFYPALKKITGLEASDG